MSNGLEGEVFEADFLVTAWRNEPNVSEDRNNHYTGTCLRKKGLLKRFFGRRYEIDSVSDEEIGFTSYSPFRRKVVGNGSFKTGYETLRKLRIDEEEVLRTKYCEVFEANFVVVNWQYEPRPEEKGMRDYEIFKGTLLKKRGLWNRLFGRTYEIESSFEKTSEVLSYYRLFWKFVERHGKLAIGDKELRVLSDNKKLLRPGKFHSKYSLVPKPNGL